jgi:S1-C subfamily serine protease
MNRLLAPLIVLASGHLAVAVESPAAPSDVYKSVLRIEVATQAPDYHTPWNAGRFSGAIGSGFIIGKNRILTNAHVVSNARRVLINIYGSSKKHPARVDYIAHDCDLALLSVEDFSDFEAFPAFALGDIPSLESQVRVIGYPIGGERLSVTRGVVSRIDFQAYSHSRADSHLIIQIDAAINPGNSGGPCVQDGKVVGVAFQGLRQADNTGYIIPTPVVKRFLKDIEDGKYDQYVELGITEFPLFNPAMRKALGRPDDDMGVLITNVVATSSADGLLKPGDILMSINDLDVDSAGMVSIDGETVSFNEIIERKFAGDKIAVRVLRDGRWQDVQIVLKPLQWGRMYAIDYESKPRYIVFAGLVFQPLDTNLFASAKFDDINVRRLFSDYVPKGIFLTRQDIVMLTRVESDPVTSQLDGFAGFAVAKINGTEVRDLAHAYELLYPPQAPEFFVIELLGSNRPLIIPSAKVADANARIQKNCGITRLFNLNP